MSSQITSNTPQINLDDYEIKEYICRSSYSFVCKAIDKKTKKEVAIKSLILNEKMGKEEIRMFIHEIDVSCIDIPDLVKIIGYRFQLTEEERKKSKYIEFNIPGYNKPIDLTGFIIVMDYYKINIYKPIIDYLKSNGSQHDLINLTIRSKIIFGISSIMKQFHAKNAIHRDLRIENIFLNDEFEPIISVFRFSKFITIEPEMVMIIASHFTMAPELFMDDSYSFPVDVYSYGFLLYKMFSTKITFAGRQPRTSQQHMFWISKGKRPDRPENIPDHYWELIQQCWKEKPEERPTFEEITELLKSDKYALNEYGMKTNLDELHRYQDKIEGI